MTKWILKIVLLLAIVFLFIVFYKPDLLTSGQTYFERGKISFELAMEDDTIEQDKLEDAILNFEKAISKGITDREVFDQLASSYTILNGDSENAGRVYSLGLSYYPNDSEFYFSRANCRAELKEFKAALLDYDKCISLEKTKEKNFTKEAIYSRGAMRHLLGDVINAEKDLQSAQKQTDYELRSYDDYCQHLK